MYRRIMHLAHLHPPFDITPHQLLADAVLYELVQLGLE